VSVIPGETDGAVATIEEEPAADLVPDETPAVADGVQYLASGKVRFTIEGAPFTLRNPKIGEFRRLHELWVEGSKLPTEQQLDHQLKWVKLMFNGDPDSEPPQKGLSDHALPDDPNDWVTWVGVATYQAKVMVHFRDVPLAPGGPAGS
jgi:hypothetical protein